MSALPLRLDRFRDVALDTSSQPPIAKQLTSAFDDGYAQGSEAARKSQLGNLAEALNELSEKLQDEDMTRSAIQAEVLSTLAPLLELLMNELAPLGIRARLKQMLATEFQRMVDDGTPRQCTIRCDPQLAGEVRNILQQFPLKHVQIEPLASAGLRVELSLDGAGPVFNPAALISGIRAFLQHPSTEAPNE